ncbi:hypothetical protein KIN20_029115 [Parelaphostrongylus tenuis]|uniref:Uncharacterized protein n=1 Tax=Parelaphostrongylus tenuis TaxID=148309 RepID=A0AAD5R269_PARTN|nr:hypothetical protein KIN20_029115 [Parelaphostrongylus tenuis]
MNDVTELYMKGHISSLENWLYSAVECHRFLANQNLSVKLSTTSPGVVLSQIHVASDCCSDLFLSILRVKLALSGYEEKEIVKELARLDRHCQYPERLTVQQAE